MSVAVALQELGITEWTLDGEPTTEEEFNIAFKKVTGVGNNNTAIVSSEPNDFGVSWTQIQTALENGGVVAMAHLRMKRNQLLAETDWMSASDYTMSDSWTTYRQALRDLPANNTNASWDGTTLGNVTFPTKPS